MVSGDNSDKKKEGEDDLLSQLPGYIPFSAQQQQAANSQLASQLGSPAGTQPGHAPANFSQPSAPVNPSQQQPAGPPPSNNPWFPNQATTSQPPPAYPVSAGYVGPAEAIGPTGIELPKLRPQDDPNSSEYIPKTPVLNAPAPDPSSPWIPVPEPKWDLFAEEKPQPKRPPQEPEKKPLPAGGSQANAIPFNSLPIVTGGSYADLPLEPAWPGAQEAAMQSQNAQNFQQQYPQLAQQGFAQGASQPSTYTNSQPNSQAGQQQFIQQGNQQVNQQSGQYQQNQPGQPYQQIDPQLQQNQQPAWPNANPGRNQNQPYEQPQRSRSKLFGAAPDQLKEVPPPSVGLSFSKNDILGIATYNLNVTKDILSNPQGYFQSLPLTGGYGEPLLYLVFTSILSSIMFAVSKLNPLLFFWGMIIAFLSVTVGAVITDLAFKRLGGKGDLEGTFRVLAFSKATFVFAWIALGQISLGAMLATMATGYMCYIGLMRVQGLSPKSTIIIVSVLSVLSMIFRMSCPGI